MRKQTNVPKINAIKNLKSLSKVKIENIKGGAAIENGPDFLTN